MPILDSLADEIIDNIRTVLYPTLYAGVLLTAPALDGTGATEPVGGSYARIPIDMTGDMSASALSSSANTGVFSFPTPTGNWGTRIGYALWDAATSGDIKASYISSTPKPINTGDNVAFPIGNLLIRNAS